MPQLVPNFLTLVIVIFVARFFGWIFRRLGQPSVMGEVLGGIVLGPSVFGYFFPQSAAAVFHPEALMFLRHISDIGITLYLFVMGLELNLPRIRRSARSALVISQLSIVFPFMLGVLFASAIFEKYAPPGVGSAEFALFIGVTLSITAFPVLARILTDLDLHRSRLGELALTCAAVNDITAWCLVAFVTGILGASVKGAWITIALTVLYCLFMLLLVRPAIEKYLPRLEKSAERLPQALLAFAVLGALGSAAITDAIGIHAFFGAFLFGAAIPHDSLIARDTTGRLQDFVAILFLPAFFALSGVKTQIGLLSGLDDGLICALIIVLAVAGKFGGTFVGSRLAGYSARDASVLGILMNTRGLVELIVLNIGLGVGILTPTLFTMLMLMALVTTFMTGPLLHLVSYRETPDRA